MLIGFLGAVIAIALFNQARASLSSLDFQMSLQLFNKAETEIVVPPLGTVSAKTHLSPVKISLLLNNINLKSAEELLVQEIEQQKIIDNLLMELSQFLKGYVVKIIGLGIVGAMIAVFLHNPGNLKAWMVGGLAGLFFSSTLVGSVYLTYDYSQFYQPQYYGALENAPWVLNTLQEGLTKFGQLGAKIQTVVQNVDTLYRRLDNSDLVGVDDNALRILHVSDIHNNPLAFQLIEKIVHNFEVDIIVDTGDMTDFGTPFEALLADRIESLEVPYLFVAGNHDSPQVIDTLKRLKNVINVSGEIINVQGFNFVGINDPASASNDLILADQTTMAEYARQLKKLIDSAGVVPDLLLVHNPWLAKQFTGQIPLILYGHNHQYEIEINQNTVLVDAGTTGAAGVRGFMTAQEIPYSLVLLNFQKQTAELDGQSWKLESADIIKLFNGKAGFTVEHQAFTD